MKFKFLNKMWNPIKRIFKFKRQRKSLLPTLYKKKSKNAFELSMALPGLDKKDIRIEVQNNLLHISSEKRYEKEEQNFNWIRKEFSYASFQRIFELPPSADPDQVEAQLKNGVLNVKVGKKNNIRWNTARTITVK